MEYFVNLYSTEWNKFLNHVTLCVLKMSLWHWAWHKKNHLDNFREFSFTLHVCNKNMHIRSITGSSLIRDMSSTKTNIFWRDLAMCLFSLCFPVKQFHVMSLHAACEQGKLHWSCIMLWSVNIQTILLLFKILIWIAFCWEWNIIKSCPCHNSNAVVAWARFYCDLFIRNGAIF